MKRNSWKRSTGIIAVAAQEIARYTEFAVCLGELGLAMRGGWHVRANYGCDVAFSRNRLATNFMDDPKRPEWLWFIDDDHTFRAETLQQLLDTGADLVAPLVLKKHHPFPPVAQIDGRPIGLKGRTPQLREVHTTGTAGLLIRRRVLEKIGPPYFRLNGQGTGTIDEDRDFCIRAREQGFRVMVDTRLPISHYTPAAIVLVQDPESGEAYSMLVVHGEQGPTAIPMPYEEPWLEEPIVQPHLVTDADEIPVEELEQLKRATLEQDDELAARRRRVEAMAGTPDERDKWLLDVERDDPANPTNQVPFFERPPEAS